MTLQQPSHEQTTGQTVGNLHISAKFAVYPSSSQDLSAMINALHKNAVQGKVRDYGPDQKMTQVTSAFFKESANFGIKKSAQI